MSTATEYRSNIYFDVQSKSTTYHFFLDTFPAVAFQVEHSSILDALFNSCLENYGEVAKLLLCWHFNVFSFMLR